MVRQALSAAEGWARSAVISPCGHYRYALGRRWGPGPELAVVMLNPSSADASRDDPTSVRCCRFAAAAGFGAMLVVNLYAYRATDPRELAVVPDPVGPDNHAHLVAAAARGDLVVAGWGIRARPERVRQVLALPGFQQVSALGITRAGHPRHPLYVPASAQLRPWPPQE